MARWVLAILLLIWLARPAGAELFTSQSTLGSRIADADCVVRGVVTQAEQVASPDPAVKSEFPWWKIQLEVRETFTGSPAATMTVFCHGPDEPDWAREKSEQLFFLRTGITAAGNWPGIADLLKSVPWTAVDFPMGLPDNFVGAVITDDLRLLHTVDEVLAEARRVGKMSRSPVRAALVLLPEDVAKRVGMSRWEWLNVGMTEGTCKTAREWIASSNPALQWCGAEVLVHQNTPENAAALRHFAAAMPQAPRYDLEAQARVLEVLHSWGVGDLPALIKSAPLFEAHRLNAWVSLAGWLLAPAAYVAWRRRRTRLLTGLWWTLMAGVVVLGIRSYWPQDAVTWGDFDVALERGHVYVVHHHRASAGLPSPLAVCTPRELLKYQYAEYGVPMDGQLNNLGEIGVPFEESKSFAEVMRPWWMAGLPVSWRARLLGPVWEIPMIVIAAVLAAPGFWMGFWWWIRRVRQRQARGFPVVINDTPVKSS